MTAWRDKFRLLLAPPLHRVPGRVIDIVHERVRRWAFPTPTRYPTERELGEALTETAPTISPVILHGAQSPDIAVSTRDLFPGYVDRLLERAADVMAHRFDLLGWGMAQLPTPLDWHVDFNSGVRWDPHADYRRVRETASRPGGDIKAPWELSRSHFLLTLGQAFRFTGDAAYARKAVELMLHWIESNPPAKGVNWNCTMEVAIRALNWLAGLELLSGADALTPAVVRRLVGALLVHARHIRANLEAPGTNHHFADLVGLLALGVALPARSAIGWRRLAQRKLVAEMRRDVPPDGAVHEASTGYHALVTEMALLSMLLTKAGGESFPASTLRQIRQMVETVAILVKPSGRLPQIGDYDSGRMLPLGGHAGLDAGHLLAFGASLFDDFIPPPLPADAWIDAVWLCGEQAIGKAGPMREGLFAFADSGWYVYRDANAYLLISCGPIGLRGRGAHGHNDKLSFELAVAGQELIVDPGAYIYTPDPAARDAFRSTGAHNTVTIDGQEQNRFLPGTAFGMIEDARARCIEWKLNDGVVYFRGLHRGYERLDSPVIHERVITCDPRGRLEIEDRLSGGGQHRVRRNFTLAPGVTPTTDAHRVNLAWESGSASLAFEEGAHPIVASTWYSPEYGRRAPTFAVSVEEELALPVVRRVTLNW